jgi:phage head maturation protease
MARIAHALYSGGFLNTVSVGFIPLRWEDAAESSSSSFSSSSSTPFRRKYLAQELLEVSAVAIPANPSALALGLKSGAVEKADLRELSELLRQATASPSDQPLAAPESDAGRSANNYQHLLALARSIRDQLKKL